MANYTILLIDYEPRSVERLRAPLERAGFRVEMAKNGEAGLLAFERLQPALTLVEAMLPKIHGFDVCRMLKATEHGKSTPVVIMTSMYKSKGHRRQAMQTGCDGYLQKPIGEDDLVTTVRDLLGIDLAAEAGDGSKVSEPELEIVERLDSVLSDKPVGSAARRRESADSDV